MGRIITFCLLVAVLAAAEPEPLAAQGDQAAAIHHALQALTRGDPAPLAALPAATFRAPIGIAYPADAGLLRRWTVYLPQAITRAPEPGRAAVVQALDALFLAAGADAQERERIAPDFLPAPSAIAALRREADRRFDRGELVAFLGCMARLESAGIDDPSSQARRTAARTLIGLAPDPGPEPPILGVLPSRNPMAGPLAPPRDHAPAILDNAGSARWFRRLGVWLVAVDHRDAVLWQRAMDRNAECAWGPGGAVVREAGATHFIDETGRLVLASPIPPGARILGVAGGCAWLAMDGRAWRVAFDGGAAGVIDMDAEPFGPPVMRGTRTLWLDAFRLTLRDGDRVMTRSLHGLPATQGWRLRADTATGGVAVYDGDRWQCDLASVDERCRDDATPEWRAFLLAASGQDTAARALLAATPADAAHRSDRLQAELALGRDHVAAHWQELLPLTDQTAWLAVILHTGLPASEQALRALTVAEPSITLPGDASLAGRPLWNPSSWDHRCDGAAWRAAQTSRVPTGLPLPDTVRTDVVDDAVARMPNGDLHHRGWRYNVGRHDGWCLLTCRSVTTTDIVAGAPRYRWSHRWPACTELSAPSITLAIRNNRILVMEGDHRFSAFASADGNLIARVALPAGAVMWSDAAVPHNGAVALLGPVGIDDRAWLIDGGEQRRIDLPVPARWLLPIAGKSVAILRDNRALWLPDLTPCPLPEPLITGPKPVVTDNGLVQGERLYRWSKP